MIDSLSHGVSFRRASGELGREGAGNLSIGQASDGTRYHSVSAAFGRSGSRHEAPGCSGASVVQEEVRLIIYIWHCDCGRVFQVEVGGEIAPCRCGRLPGNSSGGFWETKQL